MAVPKGTRVGGRQKGTPNKATADVKAIASQYTDEAIATLAKIMKDTQEAAPARVAAARELLDRGHGKARQSIEVDANVSVTDVSSDPEPTESEWSTRHAR